MKHITPDDFTRVNNDVNGNPRFVLHFLALTIPADDQLAAGFLDGITRKYNAALTRAKLLGGRKFSNKQYGGGIVFSSYNLHDLCEKINQLHESEAAHV
jgi:hypothetical protein